MRRLEGQTVLVTGAAVGLGRALSLGLVDRGARVGALDWQEDALDALVSELCRRGGQAAGAVADVRDRSAVAAAVKQLDESLGPIETVIANAGVTHRCPFGPGEAEAVRRVLEVNFLGAVHTAEAVFDSVVEHGGLFVAISSVAGIAPLIRRTGYAASKHAMEGFFGSLRSELRGTGADVLVVRPAFIATQIREESDGPEGDTLGSMMTAERVAEKILRGMERRRKTLHIGWIAHGSRWVAALVPGLYEWVMRRQID